MATAGSGTPSRPEVSASFVLLAIVAPLLHGFIFLSFVFIYVYPVLLVVDWWLASWSGPRLRVVWSLLAGIAVFFLVGFGVEILADRFLGFADPRLWSAALLAAIMVWVTSGARWRRRIRGGTVVG